MIPRRLMAILCASLLTAAIWTTPRPANAEWPERTIKVIAHTGAGGALDTMLRKLAALLEKRNGWSVAVENHQGGGGAVALGYVLSQPADGYTLLGVTPSLSSNLALGVLPIKIDDLHYLTMLLGEATAVVVRDDSQFETLKDFVTYMKQHPNGKRIGGAGRGANDFPAYQLKQVAGYEANWIPFDSGKEPIINLLGGHIDVAFMSPGTAVPQLRSGDLRLIALSTEERSSDYPKVPTFREQGFDVTNLLYRGLVARAGIPDAAAEKIVAAYTKLESDQEWKAFANSQNAMLLPLKGEAFKAYVAQKARDLKPYFKEIGALK